jgi:hypothetical protein
MENSVSDDKLKIFFEELLGVKIDENTVLFKDLDLIGHDASEFMLKFSTTFGVDLSNFKFSDYFLEESNIPFHYWLQKLFKAESIRRKEFNINHLRKVVEAKRWIDI